MGIEIEVGCFRENGFGGTENGYEGESDVIIPVGKVRVKRNGKGGTTESSLITGSVTSFRKTRGERGEGRFRRRHVDSVRS